MVDVQRQRDYSVDWRFISLWILNEENSQAWYTPEYRAGHFLGHKGLRIANAVRLANGGDDDRRSANEVVGRWYTALGEAIHRDARREEARADHEAFLAVLLDDVGLDRSFIADADDESHDAWLRSETELALSRTGPDVGTPIMTFAPTTDREASFFGPVIPKAPTGEAALDLWDAVEKLSRSGVAELKRSLRGTPDFT